MEQLVFQFEARQAILFRAGLELTEDKMHYKTVIQSSANHIEATGETLRVCLGVALRDLLLGKSTGKVVH